MEPTLNHSFQQLENQRQSLLKRIQGLSRQQLNNHPEGKWSIAQVLSHIIASEQLSVRYLNKKFLGIHELPDSGLVEEIKLIILIISQRLPLKFRAPGVVVENTTVYQSPEELTKAWDKTRGEMKEILFRFKKDQLNRKVYKHPYAGMLNVKQALRFLREHIIHHTPQVIRLLSRK